ncbi:MAG: hypothetical protein QXI58_04975 [Candidatus Micrarchaeia archaeon]
MEIKNENNKKINEINGEEAEEKLISRILGTKVLKESLLTGKIGQALKDEAKRNLGEIYKEIMKKKEEVKVPPILPDEAEIWIRKIYSEKISERELDDYIKKTLEKITDENEREKARIYLAKFHRIVIRSVCLIKDYSLQIEEMLERLNERTIECVDEIKERKKDEKIGKVILNYIKKIVRYTIQVLIPAGGIKILENTFQFVRDADFLQKAAASFIVFAIEEGIINAIIESRRRKKIKEIYEEYDKKEIELKEKARRIMSAMINLAVKDLYTAAENIYGFKQNGKENKREENKREGNKKEKERQEEENSIGG